MHHWNEIKTFNIKRNTTKKGNIFFKTKKSFYKYKGSPSVSCKKPHMSYFNIRSTGINATYSV